MTHEALPPAYESSAPLIHLLHALFITWNHYLGLFPCISCASLVNMTLLLHYVIDTVMGISNETESISMPLRRRILINTGNGNYLYIYIDAWRQKMLRRKIKQAEGLNPEGHCAISCLKLKIDFPS